MFQNVVLKQKSNCFDISPQINYNFKSDILLRLSYNIYPEVCYLGPSYVKICLFYFIYSGKLFTNYGCLLKIKECFVLLTFLLLNFSCFCGCETVHHNEVSDVMYRIALEKIGPNLEIQNR